MLFLLYVSSKCLLSVYSMPGIVLSAGDEPTNMGDWSCTRAANRFASRHLQGGEVSASSYCSWDSQGKNTEVVCHPLLQWTTFCQNSPPRSVRLAWPYMTGLTFIELDKAVVHVIRLVSFLWLWFQSVCPLMLSLRACHLTGVSLTLDVGYVLTAVATDLGCRVSPLGHVSLQLCEATSHCSSFFSITCWGID